MSGLTIKSASSNIAPVIYLNGYYQAYRSGDVELEEVVNNILKVYEKHKLDQSIDMTQFLNYENVRNLTFGEERKTSEVIEAMHKNMEFKGAEGYKKAAFS